MSKGMGIGTALAKIKKSGREYAAANGHQLGNYLGKPVPEDEQSDWDIRYTARCTDCGAAMYLMLKRGPQWNVELDLFHSPAAYDPCTADR